MVPSTTINSHLSCEQNLLCDVPSDTRHQPSSGLAYLVIVIPIVIVSPLGAQITVTELQSPYSFVHDPSRRAISSRASTASRRPPITTGSSPNSIRNGKLLNLKFIQGGKGDVTLHAPKGMAVVEHVLYVADLDTLRGFDTATGKPVLVLTIRSPHLTV